MCLPDEMNLKIKKFFLPGLALIGVVACSGYWLAQIWLGPTVTGYKVSRATLVQTVTANGQVSLPANIEVASNTGGKIAFINVKAGQTVKAGQILIKLVHINDHLALEKARAEIALAEARFRKISELAQAGSRESVQRAKTSLESAKKQNARISLLSGKGVVGTGQKSDALRNLAIAQSQLATALFQAKANRAKGSEYALAEMALHKAHANEQKILRGSADRVIKAEVDGILLSCNVVPGNVIKPHKTLMEIFPTGKTRLLVRLDEKIIPGIKLGQQYRVMADGHADQHFNAEISEIDSASVISQGIVAVKFNVNKAPDFLTQNMPVVVEIEAMRKTGVLSLSPEAVRNGESAQPWVMVVENGRAQRKAIKLGLRGKTRVEVVEGLHEGDFVIPSASFDIEEGNRIRLARN